MQPSLSKKTAAYTQTNKSTNTEQSRTPTMKMTGAQHRLVENHTVTQIRVQQTLIYENLIKAQRFIITIGQPLLFFFFFRQGYATQHCRRVVTQESAGLFSMYATIQALLGKFTQLICDWLCCLPCGKHKANHDYFQ